MRKLFLTVSVFLCTSAVVVNAQEDSERVTGTTTKSGQQILPKAGDFALGIDATPFLKYVGNMFNNSENNKASGMFNGVDQTIYGKYFLTDKSALRAKLMLNIENTTNKEEVPNVDNVDKKVENSTSVNNSGFGLELGYEFRRGYGRLQGYVGPQIGIATRSEKNSQEFGNKLSSKFPDNYERPLEFNSGTLFSFGAGGFIGVEYFIAPKISVGGEFGLSFVSNSQGKSKSVSEKWKSNSSSIEVITDESFVNPTSESRFGTQTKGNLFVMFHF